MTILSDYDQFAGRYPDTGALCNVLAYQARDEQPLSEAMLLGISGGVTVGYFPFYRKGHAPDAVLVTRYSFYPIDHICQRLNMSRSVKQTLIPARGTSNLTRILKQGKPALVWVDTHSLPYTGLKPERGEWFFQPVVVYGYDAEADKVYIADRARQPFFVTTQQLADARGRTEHNRYKLMSIGAPDMTRLPDAITQGINACIDLYQNGINKQNLRGHFGSAGLQKWADDLTSIKGKDRWSRIFPAGAAMYTALTSLYVYIESDAARAMYADFLDESAAILNNAGLKNASGQFRSSANAWHQLANMLLPEDVPLLKETRDLLTQKNRVFVEQGQQAVDEIKKIARRLEAIKKETAKNFPLNEVYAYNLREALREQVVVLFDIEKTAINALRDAVS